MILILKPYLFFSKLSWLLIKNKSSYFNVFIYLKKMRFNNVCTSYYPKAIRRLTMSALRLAAKLRVWAFCHSIQKRIPLLHTRHITILACIHPTLNLTRNMCYLTRQVWKRVKYEKYMLFVFDLFI